MVSDMINPFHIRLMKLLSEISGKEVSPNAFYPSDQALAYVLLIRIKMVADANDDALNLKKLRHILETGFNAYAENAFEKILSSSLGAGWENRLTRHYYDPKKTRFQAMITYYVATHLKSNAGNEVLDAICDTCKNIEFWYERAIVPLLAILYAEGEQD